MSLSVVHQLRTMVVQQHCLVRCMCELQSKQVSEPGYADDETDGGGSKKETLSMSSHLLLLELLLL